MGTDLLSAPLLVPPTTQPLAEEGIRKWNVVLASSSVAGSRGYSYNPPCVPTIIKKESKNAHKKKTVTATLPANKIAPEGILHVVLSAFDILEKALRVVLCFCDKECHSSDALISAQCKDMAFNGACVLTLFKIHAGLYGRFCGYDMHCLANDMNVLLKAKPRPLHHLALDIEDARRLICEMCLFAHRHQAWSAQKRWWLHHHCIVCGAFHSSARGSLL